MPDAAAKVLIFIALIFTKIVANFGTLKISGSLKVL
jgi:hypothetical protein